MQKNAFSPELHKNSGWDLLVFANEAAGDGHSVISRGQVLFPVFPKAMGRAKAESIKIEQLLKLLVKRYAKYQRELCGRVELSRFN